MSSEQTLDPKLVEQTKQQIRSLVAEIARLAKEDVSPQEFYGEFLRRVVDALAAVGGAVWATNEDGRLALQCEQNIQQTQLRENEEGQAQHSRLLYKTLSAGETLLVPPHSSTGDDANQQIGNPTDFLLLLGPLKTDLEVVGVLEIFQRSEAGPNTQKGYLRFLEQMCDLAADFLKSHQLRHFSDRQVLWSQLEDFTHQVHTSLDAREAAYMIANEGRRLIECDRVSVAIRKGNKCIIEAVSGQDLFDKRSNTVRLLGKLATAVTATGDSIWYTGDTTDMAPQVEDAVQEYVDESHSKNVAVLPLKRPTLTEEDDPNKRQAPEEPIGALIVEQIEDSRVPQSMIQRVDVVCRHSSTALANALEHENLFLMPVWRALGKTRWILQARTLPKTLTVAGLVLGFFLFLILYRGNFELDADGTLLPVERRDVYAMSQGEVAQLYVDTESVVSEGQLLGMLTHPETELGMVEISGKLSAIVSNHANLRAQLTDGQPRSPADRDKLWTEITQLEVDKQTYQMQYELYKQKMKDLEIRSPIDGVVLTWDLGQVLRERPVERGNQLMEIVDPDGPWEIELQMAEDRMGHLDRALAELNGQLREELRAVLRAELGEIPNEALDAKLAQILDKDLRTELRKRATAELHQRLEEQITTLVGSVTDPTEQATLQARLDETLADETYTGSRGKLQAAAAAVSDATIRQQLSDIAGEERDDQLKVRFRLATDPSKEFTGRVDEIELRAEVRGEEGSSVKIRVAMDRNDLPLQDLTTDAEVTAYIHCGKRSIGYCYLHDLVAWIHRIAFRWL